MRAPIEDPMATSQYDPDAEHDQVIRKAFAKQVAQMLRDQGQFYSAELVLAERTDGQWP